MSPAENNDRNKKTEGNAPSNKGTGQRRNYNNNPNKYKKRRRTYPKTNTQSDASSNNQENKQQTKPHNTQNVQNTQKNQGNRQPRNPQSNPNQSNTSRKAYKPNRKWDTRKVRIEETVEDIIKENERIEKEIWLEIAEIHNLRID